MKLLLTYSLLSVFVVCGLCASGTCPVQSCATSGGSCGRLYGNETIQPNCPINQFCNTSDTGSVCVNMISPNSTCDPYQSPQCAGNYVCQLSNISNPASSYLCLPPIITKYPGDSCSGSDVCFYYGPNGSVNNCTNGICYGLSAGESCSVNFVQCVNGTYCSSADNSTCVATKANGDNCTSDGECQSAVCIPQTADGMVMTCGNLLSGTNGSFCVEDISCGEGLWCDVTNGTVGTCAPIGNSSLTACDPTVTPSNCTAPQTCQCLYNGTAVCVSPTPTQAAGTNASAQALASCLSDNFCASGDQSCQLKYCLNETCAYTSLTFAPGLPVDWRQQVLSLPCLYTSFQINLAVKCQNLQVQVQPDSSGASIVLPAVTFVVMFMTSLIL